MSKMQEHENYTDEELAIFWQELGEVGVDDYGVTDVDFYFFPVGTYRETIWQWFDNKHSKGVYFLMFPSALGAVDGHKTQ